LRAVPALEVTRTELQRVAVHLLARRRLAATGRFGLRATPGGFGTPAFGAPDAPEVLRVDGTLLVHELGGDVRTWTLPGRSLLELAEAVGADLGTGLSVGEDTPPLGDAGAPLQIDPVAAERLGAWLDLGWRSLDRVAGGAEGAVAVQLWPEHFDAGTSVAVGSDRDDRANLGASLGDDLHPEPYLYVGPWGPERPGDPAYWNAPFGALVGMADVADLGAAVAFLQRGIDLLRARHS
jgi:hypothetical protein